MYNNWKVVHSSREHLYSQAESFDFFNVFNRIKESSGSIEYLYFKYVEEIIFIIFLEADSSLQIYFLLAFGSYWGFIMIITVTINSRKDFYSTLKMYLGLDFNFNFNFYFCYLSLKINYS